MFETSLFEMDFLNEYSIIILEHFVLTKSDRPVEHMMCRTHDVQQQGFPLMAFVCFYVDDK